MSKVIRHWQGMDTCICGAEFLHCSPEIITTLLIGYCQVTSVVSDSVQPHRWQPTKLPRPWDSPGKNTGVGCNFLLQCMKAKGESEVAQSTPWTAAYQAVPSMGFSRQEYWSGVPLPSPITPKRLYYAFLL